MKEEQKKEKSLPNLNGTEFRLMRVEMGYTQEGFARILGLKNRHAIWRLEQRDKVPAIFVWELREQHPAIFSYVLEKLKTRTAKECLEDLKLTYDKEE
jgi:DNA-binding XRE family transcriptional regulator